jgi:hypothetical protein
VRREAWVLVTFTALIMGLWSSIALIPSHPTLVLPARTAPPTRPPKQPLPPPQFVPVYHAPDGTAILSVPLPDGPATFPVLRRQGSYDVRSGDYGPPKR